MNKNHETSIKNLDMQIGKLSRRVISITCSSGGVIGNNDDDPKNETCKAIELGYGVEPILREDGIYE